MKKIFIHKLRNALLPLLLLAVVGNSSAQVHTLELKMDSLRNPTTTTVEFALFIKNLTPDSVSNLSFIQFGFDLPANIGNGGTMTLTKIGWNPSLPASQQAQTTGLQISGQPAAPHARSSAQTTSSALAGSILTTGNGTYYGTYRITNTVPFATNALLTFTPIVNNVAGKTRTNVAAYVNGSSTGGTAFSALGSTPVQSALRVLSVAAFPSITLNQPTSTCPTSGTANVTDPTCFGGLGSAVVTLTPNPSPATGTYSVDGGAATAYTSNPFTVSGLSQGSHTVTVTNDPNCAPFDVVLTVGGPSAPPPPPSLACYQTATFNSTTCQWDVTGTQPAMPNLACYQTASFNNTTCQWDITGSQPAMPSLACYETASFNTTTCQWDVTGSMPAMPSLACYQTASFNTTTCQWDVTGSMPPMPALACYETASFNNTTCQWDVTGSMPAMPSLACYQTASFNTTTCQWDVTGSMPPMPALACYETASFNNTTCQWDVTGSMPAMPSLACYQTASFNTTACQWDVTGSMPPMPALACYQTASFNNTTCQWDVTGTMPAMPSLACYETASFNNTTCQWDVTGTMPAMPSLACYQTASFNTTTCQWDVTGTQPAAPTGLACYETATFNNTTCQWDVTGSMPAMPNLACYQTASFNTTTCQWDVTGTPNAPIITTYSGCDSYTWSVNNATYTSSGTYTVNLACQDYILYLTLGQTTSSTITINAPLSYTWSCNNTTYTTSGTYTCSGTNASGCPDTQTLILNIGGCNLTVTAANVTGCPNSPITLSGTPAGGTFSVANPYTGPSTTYTYSYTDPNTGCSGTATGTITVVSVASVTITSVVVTGPSSVTVNWNQVPGLGWYGVRYRPINSATWSPEQTQAAPAASKNLVGLQAGTTYEIEVRGHCSLGNAGPWGSNTVFTTAAPCGTPSGLFAAPVTGTTAKLNWAVVPGATWYQVRYRKVGVTSWSSGGTAMSNSKSYTGLSLSTQYEWQVRAVCGIATGPWSSMDNFTTLASKQEVDLTDESINNQISVYPNPVRDNLNVEISSDIAQNTVVKVFDMSGRLIKQIQANAEIGITTLTINLSDVAAGMYQVQVFANDKLTHVSKVNKQD